MYTITTKEPGEEEPEQQSEDAAATLSAWFSSASGWSLAALAGAASWMIL